jgi:phosphoribosyl 1,2-cyclic phosphodiesterase
MESSLLVEAGGARILLDSTRDFSRQVGGLDRLDCVVLTHAHADASGGVAQLRRWWLRRSDAPLPAYASEETVAALRRRYRRLDGLDLVVVPPGETRSQAGMSLTPLTVPHAREAHYPTYAWRLSWGGVALVYASDVAKLTEELEAFCAGASTLVVDSAMWGRVLFSHLTIDRELRRLCGWEVSRIVLTQIGRTAPPHERLAREVKRRCSRARPAYDGMRLRLR